MSLQMVFSGTSDHPANFGMPAINEDESVKILNRFEQWGGTFIDTHALGPAL